MRAALKSDEISGNDKIFRKMGNRDFSISRRRLSREILDLRSPVSKSKFDVTEQDDLNDDRLVVHRSKSTAHACG